MDKTMDKKTYTQLMAEIAEGTKVTREVYDEMVAFAKKAKVKKPSEDAILAKSAVEETKKETKAAKAKEPKAKVRCSVTGKEDPKMEKKSDRCTNDARSNGMCATHYSRLVYRAKPENAEKARQASKNYAAKVRAAKAEAKAAAAAAAV